MKLKDRVSKDYMNAMREKDTLKKNLLSVAKGEIQTIEKNKKVEDLSDDEVLVILTKMAKSVKENISLTSDPDAVLELSILEEYLPKQMTREEIVIKVSSLVENGVVQVGGIMKEFAGLPVDRKVVSEVIKELLN